MTIPWIVDCDPGCDDALALALLSTLLPAESPVTVLTVAGNVGVDSTTGNACRVVEALKRNWKVYRGCGGSLTGDAVPAASVHGRDGLGDVPNNAFDVRAPRQHLARASAVQRLLCAARDGKQFVLVCTGPLTNLATALNLMDAEEQGRFWLNCKFCVVMGGAFEVPGNITASAEFNSYFDPVAAQLVLESWRQADAKNIGPEKPSPIHFVPLDVTEIVGIELPAAPEANGDIARFLQAMLRKYAVFHARFCGRPSDVGISPFQEEKFLVERALGKSGLKQLGAFCYLHDPLAIWAAWSLSESGASGWWSTAHVTIDADHGPERGRVILHRKKDVPSKIPALGTPVRWLDPMNFQKEKRDEFIAKIKKVLEIR